MVAIVSLLDAEHSDKLNEITFQLDREFGLKEVQMTPFPHLTWLTVNDGSLHNLQETLGNAAGICCRLQLVTSGLGIFTGSKPVLYIPVVRSGFITRFHRQLHDGVSLICNEIGQHYSPSIWMPHLSLALGDTTPELVAEAFLYLNNRDFNWNIELDNLTLLTKHGDLFLKDGVFPLVGVETKDAFKQSAVD
ncbi:2'-5' RNA ligase family protein [Rufibacter soli]|jgi:2'-5' RNA ligase